MTGRHPKPCTKAAVPFVDTLGNGVTGSIAATGSTVRIGI
jgi:hypothetical protein